MRRCLEMVAIFVLCLMLPVAYGQAATNTQKISWVAPSQYVDGTAIPSTVALTYNVYARLGTASEVKLFTAVAGTSVTTAPMTVGQQNCYAITVLVNGGAESARSPDACAPVGSLAAKPVTTVVIQ